MSSPLLFLDRLGSILPNPDSGMRDRAVAAHAHVMTAEVMVRTDQYAGRCRIDAADDDPLKMAYGDYWANVQHQVFEQTFRGVRADAFSASASGSAPVGNLTELYWKRVPEPKPKLNADSAFQHSSTLAPGMQHYQMVFEADTGEAQFWAGGTGNIQSVSAGQSFVNRTQYHMISAAEVDFVQSATFAAMGSNLRERLSSQARYAHRLVKNRLVFQGGGSDLDLWGLKNYPTLGIDYTGLSLATATGAQLALALSDLINGPDMVSKQAIEVNTLLLPMSLKPKWSTVYPGGTGSDVTLGKWFAENFPGVTVRWVNELDDLLASGVHAMFAYQASGDSAPTVESSPVIFLPEVVMGVGVKLYAYSRYAGMVIPWTIGARISALEN